MTARINTIGVIIILFTFTLNVYGQGEAPQAPKGYLSNTTLKISYALGRLKLIDKKPELPSNIKSYKNIIYSVTENDTLRLDIYRHKEIKGLRPLLIFVHGGAWRKGKKEDYLPYIIPFSKKGYVCASISYSLSPKTHFPQAVSDVKNSVNWLLENANEYMIDTGKVALIGGSAGGHLSLMTAYAYKGSVKPVKVVVDIYGPVDLTTEFARGNKSVIEFLGEDFTGNERLYKEASPINYITSDDPPTLIFHGTIDDVVPVSQSDMLKNALDAKGVINEYHRLKGWPHTMDLSKEVNDYMLYYMGDFFDRYLTPNKHQNTL
ncbi:MAG: alpha/beta hydrolase [Bacteroidota bacterium]